jgi:hypothetical protein
MVPSETHHSQDPGHAHGHTHGPAFPHPAQIAPWSILRMAVLSRLAAATVLIAGLWAVVWLSAR